MRTAMDTGRASRSAMALGAGLVLFLGAGAARATDLHPYGDLGLRAETLFVHDKDGSGERTSERLQHRPEVAFGLGLRALALDDTLEANLRLTSAPTDALTDRWLAAADFGRLRQVAVDRAWLGLTMSAVPELSLTVGIAPVPWRHTGLLWDEDLTLPLAVVAWDQQRSGRAVVRRTHGSVGVIELNSGLPVEDDDIVLAGADVGATWGLGRSVTLQTDLGYVGLWGHRRLGRAVARGDVRVGQQRAGFTTNTTDTDANSPRAEPTQRLILDGLASDFDVLSAYVALRVGASELFPVTAFGHVAWNLGASGPGEGEALGLVAGVRIGDDAIAGQTAVTLRGLYIEADAALAPLNDDALVTNLKGLAIEASFGAFEGLKFAFDALYSLQVDPDLRGLGDDRGEPGSNDPTAVRLRLSSTWSF